MLPYLIKPQTFVEWRIGTMAIKLPRLAFGDERVLQPRHLLRFDTPLLEPTRPRENHLHFRYEGWKRRPDTYKNAMYWQIQEAFAKYYGEIGTIIFPYSVLQNVKTRKRYVGVAKDLVISEDDNCRISVEFDFEIQG